jgi:hypothetical protein
MTDPSAFSAVKARELANTCVNPVPAGAPAMAVLSPQVEIDPSAFRAAKAF